MKYDYAYASEVPANLRIQVAAEIAKAVEYKEEIDFQDIKGHKISPHHFIYHLLMSERADNIRLEQTIKEKNQKLRELGIELSKLKRS